MTNCQVDITLYNVEADALYMVFPVERKAGFTSQKMVNFLNALLSDSRAGTLVADLTSNGLASSVKSRDLVYIASEILFTIEVQLTSTGTCYCPSISNGNPNSENCIIIFVKIGSTTSCKEYLSISRNYLLLMQVRE